MKDFLVQAFIDLESNQYLQIIVQAKSKKDALSIVRSYVSAQLYRVHDIKDAECSLQKI